MIKMDQNIVITEAVNGYCGYLIFPQGASAYFKKHEGKTFLPIQKLKGFYCLAEQCSHCVVVIGNVIYLPSAGGNGCSAIRK